MRLATPPAGCLRPGRRPTASGARRRARAAALALVWSAAAALASPPPQSARDGGGLLRWRPALGDAPGDAPTALAVDPWGRLAVGGLRGVRGVSPEGVAEVWLRRGPVLDLVFLGGGRLLAATAEGLFRVERIERGGRVVPEALAPGEPPTVRRLAARAGSAVAATGSGVYLREVDGRWRPARDLPSRPATLVALRDVAGDLELWSVVDGALWIGRLVPGARVALERVRHVALPGAQRAEPASDVAFDLPGADVVLVFPDAFSARGPAGRWRTVRPALPPGARASRIAFAHDRLWLATDDGLLSSSRLEGPWRRAQAPLGSAPVVAIASAGGALWAATARGVLGASEAGPDDLRVRRSLAPYHAAPGEPRVGEVHAAALRYVDLRPERLRDLQRAASRRGLLPELDIDLGYVDDRNRRHDHDQAFVSGATRYLDDEQHGRDRGFDVGVSLSWDLGDAVYHPEQVDLLRESRAVIALRDDVLDEITQVYFERRRVLAERALQEPGSPEHAALALHAEELTAGLDAWTGGWFSRRLSAAASRAAGPDTPRPEE